MTDDTPETAAPATEATAATPEGPTRAGVVALIGEPNAGKSTLLNRMVGAKVSIVTHKVQTTRARIRGVAMEGAAQIVFVATPSTLEMPLSTVISNCGSRCRATATISGVRP